MKDSQKYAHLDFVGDIARVTLDHPAGNRINFAMRAELLDIFDRVAKSGARAVIVRAEGPDFCLGGDVREWPGIPANELRPRIEVFAKALERLEALKMPSIAAVQGGCMGGGFELALSCDLIVATRSARFAFPEARVGIMTLQGGVLQLAERIGRTKAIEVVMLSEPLSADQLASWNLANRVVEDDVLWTSAEDFAARLTSNLPSTNAATKELLAQWRTMGYRHARAALYDISMPLFDQTDVQQRLVATAEAMGRVVK
ncbi:enoyl-CoA hydratase/isomerase family protein [Bradyrhizobium commune]|uniref:Enoyl-CoA hydratase/isomerase family protein n=1 Tax=Bradyrhizobium commune TaxID=83627 RepID=A0A7S9D3C3_9BRAD|nr:enoyl-CoA hydratase/isomerase family protein [Bradyrhizobium commune]QPF90381.1 enoyl-CoA hydratase/isomerase family protein [Bradyrhizobium commune]